MRLYEKVTQKMKGISSAIVAFSGGVDSALMLKVAYDALKDKVVAVTADSPSVPRREIAMAKIIAKQIRAKHILLKTEEFKDKNYLQNPSNRCYYCKKELYTRLLEYAKQHGIKTILNGTNADDLKDFRPGLQAAEEFDVRSPLAEAGLKKADVRALAKDLGLTIWDKPASPCLSSRVPYDQPISVEKLGAIETAENFLKDEFGIRELRVRHFGQAARIDVNQPDFQTIEKNLPLITQRFQKLGFQEVLLHEFRSGSLNVVK